MGVKSERRFLDRSNPVDGDDGRSNFPLEIFQDCSFFDHHHDSTSSVDPSVDVDDDDDDGGGGDMTAEERRVYWESQHFLLQEIVEQYHSIGSKLRQEIKRQINIARESGFCKCEGRHCTTLCLRHATLNQLRTKGFDAHLCVSRWKTTSKTPAGWHEYIEVRANTAGKKSHIPFVVEVGFRDEFRMAKGCQEYNNLVQELPDMFIGKWEHMKAIIRLVCDAARKSAEEQKIHMGPWRKKSFMQMKWSPSSSHDHSRRRVGTSTSASSSQSSFHLPVPTTLKVA